jgi:hypothetical protein
MARLVRSLLVHRPALNAIQSRFGYANQAIANDAMDDARLAEFSEKYLGYRKVIVVIV